MFDPSAPHIIILLIVVLLLFGSRRLPGAAKSLGESMHIFKKSVHGLDESGNPVDGSATVQGATAQGPVVTQQAALPPVKTQQDQLAEMQRQIQELQRQNASAEGTVGAPLPEAQHSQQPF